MKKGGIGMESLPLVVDTEWLSQHLDDPNLRLLDATTYLKGHEIWAGKETYEKEHIPGAVFANLVDELSDPDAQLSCTVPTHERFASKISELGVGDGTYVVIYDQGILLNSTIVASYWASRLWWQLRLEGFDNVAVLDGGLLKWKEEGRSVTSEPGVYPPGNFSGERRPELLASRDDVKGMLGDDNNVLIHSLSPAEFKGETNVFARNGHIPGSKNVFFADIVDQETKELREKEELKGIFEKTGALDSTKKVVTYCGGGIAATWNALALAKLGRKDVAVYDGSMVDWTLDDKLPLDKE
jgi:thiosulfate/3-mercaptopyruvate sulfurtransferase